MRRAFVVCAGSLIAFVFALTPRPVRADDHADAPLAAADRAADIGSVYFFLDPSDNEFAVAAATVGGSIAPSMNANLGFFDSGVKFIFAFETTGDATSDFTIEVTHSKQTSRTVPQMATIVLGDPVATSFTLPTTISRAAFGPQGPPTFGGGTQAQQTPTVMTGPTGISYFGGLIDDPFFFDLGAELAYRNSRFANMTNPAILTRGRDSFAGYNTMVVALRVPVALLDEGNGIGLSVYTQRPLPPDPNAKKVKKNSPPVAEPNIDRMGNPLINNLLTSYAMKDVYNAGDTAADATNALGTATDIVNTLLALQTDATSIGILAGIAITNGDMLRLNPAIPNTGAEGGTNIEAGFPNGRRPSDDVVDTILTLINNRVFQGDAVGDNELPLKNTFPFFAQPHMPFPPGAVSEDLTRN